ncbi:MAG: hypothetical protein MHMPM18_000112 [Marteilia pararefringens]
MFPSDLLKFWELFEPVTYIYDYPKRLAMLIVWVLLGRIFSYICIRLAGSRFLHPVELCDACINKLKRICCKKEDTGDAALIEEKIREDFEKLHNSRRLNNNKNKGHFDSIDKSLEQQV